jgi:hypothetical protein
MAATRFGTFDELMAESEAALRPVAMVLRQLVLEIQPGAVEVVRLGDRAATYGLGPRKMSEGYCYVLPYTRWVNLGFFQGAQLPDPEGLLEGTGAKLRHVKGALGRSCRHTGRASPGRGCASRAQGLAQSLSRVTRDRLVRVRTGVPVQVVLT